MSNDLSDGRRGEFSGSTDAETESNLVDDAELRENSSYSQQLLDGFTILVLEDAPDTRAVVRHFLEKAGARVSTASNAKEAWDYLDHTVPTIIVSDIAMPGQDGIAFIKELRTQKMSELSAIPALALTAFNDRSVQNLALGSGFQDYLLKPITREDLVEAVLKVSGASAGEMTH